MDDSKKQKRLRASLKNLENDVEFHKQKQLDQYLEDTRKNIDIVHYSFLPQSRSHFKQHSFDVYEDEVVTTAKSRITRGTSRRHPKHQQPQPAYSETEKEDMQREITLLSIQLNDAASRKSSRRTLRSRSSRKGGTDYPDGATGTRMTTASSFSAPIPSEQIPTQEKLNARLSQRKLERGYNDSWKIPNNKDFTGIWGSRRLYLQKLSSNMFGNNSGDYRSLDSRCHGIRHGIASAPPQFFARENTFSTITPRTKPPATAATRPMTRKPTAPPQTRGKLVILRDTTLNKIPYATKMTLEEIALPSSPVRRSKRVTYLTHDYRDTSPFEGHGTKIPENARGVYIMAN
ncbi:uncharacterized protein LOC142356565 [Convolutriloba macropyga]|uniref:uncharacterized protein LOC142356565 n=1 Tax=Convolutriloba macropyga TaxID=536237 RepID=UPI003F51B336